MSYRAVHFEGTPLGVISFTLCPEYEGLLQPLHICWKLSLTGSEIYACKISHTSAKLCWFFPFFFFLIFCSYIFLGQYLWKISKQEFVCILSGKKRQKKREKKRRKRTKWNSRMEGVEEFNFGPDFIGWLLSEFEVIKTMKIGTTRGIDDQILSDPVVTCRKFIVCQYSINIVLIYIS